MRAKKTVLHAQRKRLDTLLTKVIPFINISRPRLGWIKAIRESLGLSSTQLAKRLGTDSGGILRMEGREAKGKITLQSLEKIANTMDCKLVYFVIPKEEESLDALLNKKANEAARKILNRVQHSMSLEQQSVNTEYQDTQLEQLTDEFKEKLAKEIWSSP